jgi:hypothetical protein
VELALSRRDRLSADRQTGDDSFPLEASGHGNGSACNSSGQTGAADRDDVRVRRTPCDLLREIFGLAVAQRPGGRKLLGLPRLNRRVDRRNRQAYKIIWTTEKLAA